MNFITESSSYYEHNGVKYIYSFPEEWACSHMPHSGPKECKFCMDFGMWNGIFLGYCSKCANDPYTYNGRRGSGFCYPGKLDSYLYDVDIDVDVDVDGNVGVDLDEDEPEFYQNKNNMYLYGIDFDLIECPEGEKNTAELIMLDNKRGNIMQETGKIFFMTPSEHGDYHTCSNAVPFADFVVYHLEYIKKCLDEDKEIAESIPVAWATQRIPGMDYPGQPPLSKEEEVYYYARVDFIINMFNYKQGDFDVNYVFDLLKKMPLEERHQERDAMIDAEILSKIKQQDDEDQYYDMINAYCDEHADCPPELYSIESSNYGSHYEDGYDSY